MKILYATNLKEHALTYNLIENILVLRRVGLEDMVFLQTIPFKEWLGDLESKGISSRLLIEKELSLPLILSAAKKENVSLIVVNLDKKARKPSRSSLIRDLMRRSPVPILITNGAAAAGKGLFEHVVFATDWSPASEKALTYLLGFKEIMGELDIVNVIKGKLTLKDMRELKERLAHTRKRCLDEKIDAESHIYAGKTSEEIITASRDYRATLIVLGAVSEKPAYKKIFKEGSSSKIAEEAEVPVLVIP
jgi:nucleotide-binding universal stress UspA family protein